MNRPVYITIMAAAEEGRGINLTAEEVRTLSEDDAVMLRAGVEHADEIIAEKFTWQKALTAWKRRWLA